MKKTFYVSIAILLLATCAFGLVGCSTKSLIDKNIKLLEKYAEKYEKAYKANDEATLEALIEPISNLMMYLENYKDEMTDEQKKRVVKVVNYLANLK